MPNGRAIRSPLGSFVNRYVINKLEDLERFLDGIKPVEELLWALLRRHPLRSVEILVRAIPLLRRALKPYYFRESLGFAVLLISLVIPILTAILILSYVLGTLDLLLPSQGTAFMGPWWGGRDRRGRGDLPEQWLVGTYVA